MPQQKNRRSVWFVQRQIVKTACPFNTLAAAVLQTGADKPSFS